MKTKIAALIAGLASAEEIVPVEGIEDNHVTFTGAAIGFLMDHFSITPGQPWGGVFV